MGTQIQPIGRPNHRAIASMDANDLLKVREYYIVRLVSARRSNDSDTLESCIDWLVALTSEMRMRGSQKSGHTTESGIFLP
jgi:hypothetical protein